MFTDKGADSRFDESYLALGWRLPKTGDWEMWAQVGAVHVGEGLFGQDMQNWIHRLVNQPQVDLTYIDENTFHATLDFDAFRPFDVRKQLKIGPWVDLHAAFDFKQHAIVGARLEWRMVKRFFFDARLAARYTNAELPELQPWIVEFGPAAEAGINFNHFLYASYSYNAFGTEHHHWHFHIRWVVD
jgi:hypothetical protein